MDNMKYVKTRFGKIPINELPYLETEHVYSKLYKLILFSVVIVVVITLFIIMYPRSKQCNAVEKSSPKFQAAIWIARADICVPVASPLNKVIFVVRGVDGVGLAEFNNDKMRISNTINSQFLKYSIDFMAEIMEIVLISDAPYITYADVTLYNHRGAKIWTFSNNVDPSEEISIPITQLAFLQDGFSSNAAATKIVSSDTKIIANDEEAVIHLTEDNEEYNTY